MNNYERIKASDVRVGDKISSVLSYDKNKDAYEVKDITVKDDALRITVFDGESVYDLFFKPHVFVFRKVENKEEPLKVHHTTFVKNPIFEEQTFRHQLATIDQNHWQYVAMMYGITIDEAKEALQSISKKKEEPTSKDDGIEKLLDKIDYQLNNLPGSNFSNNPREEALRVIVYNMFTVLRNVNKKLEGLK